MERADPLIERDQLGISRVEGQRPVHASLHCGDPWEELVPHRADGDDDVLGAPEGLRHHREQLVTRAPPGREPLLQQVSVRERHVVGAQLDRGPSRKPASSRSRPGAKRRAG